MEAACTSWGSDTAAAGRPRCRHGSRQETIDVPTCTGCTTRGPQTYPEGPCSGTPRGLYTDRSDVLADAAQVLPLLSMHMHTASIRLPANAPTAGSSPRACARHWMN